MIRTHLIRDLPSRRQAEVRRLVNAAIDRDSDAIGFLPFAALDAYDARGRSLVVTNNAEVVGFGLYRLNAIEQRAKVVQVWVRRDARMIEHGRALVARVARIGERQLAAPRLSLWCADDLPANAFWKALGFSNEAARLGRGHLLNPRPRARRRRHLLWSAPCLNLTRPLGVETPDRTSRCFASTRFFSGTGGS